MSTDTIRLASGALIPRGDAGAIDTESLASDAVTTAKIKDGEIGTADIANMAVTAEKLAADAVETAKIKDANVTYAKIQNVSATNRLLGRKTAEAGSVEEITVGGDITQSGSTFTIAGGVVSANKLQQAAEDLGDADVTVNLSNLNEGNVTNLTIDGIMTAESFIGNVTGNCSGSSGSCTGNAATVTNGVYTTDTGTVSGTMIAAGAVTAAKLDSGITATYRDVGVYDFAVSGGIQGIIALVGSSLPTNASITHAWYEVLDAPTSEGSATIALGVATDDADGILTATAFDNAVFTEAFHDATPNGAATNFTGKTTEARTMTITIAGADLTAGKIRVFADYCISAA